MSKAAWAGLLLTGAGVGLIAWFLLRGLPPEAKAEVEESRAFVAARQSALDEQADLLTQVVGEDEAFLDGRPEVAQARALITERRGVIEGISKEKGAVLEAAVKADRHKDGALVVATAAAMRAQSAAALDGVPAAVEEIRTILGYKRDHKVLMERGRAAVEAAEAVLADASLEERLELSAVAYPGAKAKLQAKHDALKQHAQQIVASGEKLAAQRTGEVDYVASGKLATALGEGGAKLTQAQRGLTASHEALRHSTDKILIDMKEDAGHYFHKYKIVEDGRARTTDWVEVTRKEFVDHEEHLGMAIFSKPEGTLPEDAHETAAPPGYAYVGNPRYGRWEQRSGGSFWAFYGQYAFMRTVLGMGMSPIGRSHWDSYHTSRRSRRAFFGAGNEWGTRGSLTRKRYGTSTYYKKNPRALRTGRGSGLAGGSGRNRQTGSTPARGQKFSGSKFNTSPRSGAGTRQRQGTRSGGFRSSRFRGGSRGGFGK